MRAESVSNQRELDSRKRSLSSWKSKNIKVFPAARKKIKMFATASQQVNRKTSPALLGPGNDGLAPAIATPR